MGVPLSGRNIPDWQSSSTDQLPGIPFLLCDIIRYPSTTVQVGHQAVHRAKPTYLLKAGFG